jgi:hypothetical protein
MLRGGLSMGGRGCNNLFAFEGCNTTLSTLLSGDDVRVA